MTNLTRASDWLEMSATAMRRSTRSFDARDWADAVRHAQEAQEHAAKAVLASLGKVVRKTHRPVQDIREGLLSDPSALEELGLAGEPATWLLRASASAPLVEEQGTVPRYGWDMPDRIVKPEDIYDEAIATRILDAFLETTSAMVGFFRAAALSVKQEVLDDLETGLAEYARRIRSPAP